MTVPTKEGSARSGIQFVEKLLVSTISSVLCTYAPTLFCGTDDFSNTARMSQYKLAFVCVMTLFSRCSSFFALFIKRFTIF